MLMPSGSIHRFSPEQLKGQGTSVTAPGKEKAEKIGPAHSFIEKNMDFLDLNNRLADMKQCLTQKVEAGMGEIFTELSKLYGEIRIRSEVYQELARLRAENTAMEQRHLEDVARIQTLKARLKDCRKENRSPQLRRISV